jgi:U4/U6 small nuclear ribonucleoprotein PRP4
MWEFYLTRSVSQIYALPSMPRYFPSATAQLSVTDKNGSALDPNGILPTSTIGATSEKASAILDQLERKKRLARLPVPTEDARVRAKLRELGHPITLFGEGNADRRDRLRELLLDISDEQVEDTEMVDPEEGDNETEFYTLGSEELLLARRDITLYSLPRAKHRLEFERQEHLVAGATHVKRRNAIKSRLKTVNLFGSQIAGTRAVSIVRFSPNNEMVAAGLWTGSIQLLDVPNLNKGKLLRGHQSHVGGISWLPGATLPESNISPSTVNLASGGGEGNVFLWSLESDLPIAKLSGHKHRVCRVEFHPSGRYVASASHDTSWRLWDVNTQQELVLQEGHSRECFAVSFNEDGSLLASAGLDSFGRIWDLRSGRTIMLLDGHIGPIYGLDWGPDSHRVLTGSTDGFVKCWDLRAHGCTYSVGAHKNGVTDLRWFKGTDGPHSGKQLRRDENDELQPKVAGTFFVSGGFDKHVNIFSVDDWVLTRTLSGHASNVLSVDVTSDAKWFASGARDNTVKLWTRDDDVPLDSLPEDEEKQLNGDSEGMDTAEG